MGIGFHDPATIGPADGFVFTREPQKLASGVITSQDMRSVVNADGPIQVLTDQDAASSHSETERLLWNLETAAFKSHGVVVVDDAFMLLREDLVQIVASIREKGGPRLLGF